MVHERPLLKVSRPVAACSKCRSAKIKCDGALPSCSACTKQGKEAECTSTNDNFARGKERSYVSTLETRLDMLERKLDNAPVAAGRSAPAVSSTTSLDSQTHRLSPSHVIDRLSKRQEARDVDDIVSDFGYLTVNATARDYYGFTAFFSYSRLILSSCSSSLDPDPPLDPLPNRDLISADIKHYLSRIYPLLPFYDEAALHYSLNAVYHPSRALATHFDHWIVKLVLAISIASRSTHANDQHYLNARALASAAVKQHAAHVLQPGSITGIQAMLFLVHFALFDPLALDLWNLIGATSRLMIDLGLHQDSARPRVNLDAQRRLYYCIYSLDRQSSVLHDRAFSFSDDTTNVALPARSCQPGARDDWLRGLDDALAIMQLQKIQSSIHHCLSLSGEEPLSEPDDFVWKSCHDIRTWLKALDSTRSDPIGLYLELEMLFAEIRVLCPSTRDTLRIAAHLSCSILSFHWGRTI